MIDLLKGDKKVRNSLLLGGVSAKYVKQISSLAEMYLCSAIQVKAMHSVPESTVLAKDACKNY